MKLIPFILFIASSLPAQIAPQLMQGPLPSSGLAGLVAGTPNAVYMLFNPTGASSVAPSVTSQLGSDTWTAALTTGAMNFLVGGMGTQQGGWIQTGTCGTGPTLVATGPVLSSATTNNTMAGCAAVISSTTQVQGGGILTNNGSPLLRSTSGTKNGIVGLTGATVIWWGPGPATYETTGAGAAVAGSIGFAVSLRKPSEWQIGPGTCGMHDGTTMQSYGFPSSGGSAPFLITNNGVNVALGPSTNFQMALVMDLVANTYTCYMQDGTGLFTSGPQSLVGHPTVSGSAAQLDNNAERVEGYLFLPNVKLTRAQVAEAYYGFTAATPGPYATARNQAPAFTSQPGVQWNQHPVIQSDLQDCQWFGPRTNGGNSGSGVATGSLTYNATGPHCHAQFSTSAPVVRVGMMPGLSQSGFMNMAIRIDNVLQGYYTVPTGDGMWYAEIVPGSAGSHNYDVSIGNVGGNSTVGYDKVSLYSGFSGAFFQTIDVPYPNTITIIPVTTGTTAVCITDSILCSGTTAAYNAGNHSSIGAFVPLERYSTGTTSFGTARIAAIGAGSFSMNTDFNSAGAVSGSVPTSEATTFVSTYIAPLARGTPSNVPVAIDGRGVNEWLHNAQTFGNSANCLGIYAFSVRNAYAALVAFNPSIQIYAMSMLNSTTFGEATTDGCTGDSYTTVNSLTVPKFSAGTWSPVAVPAATAMTGAQVLTSYRTVKMDVCASYPSNCTWVETGPGAVANADGTLPPTLSSTVTQCFSGGNLCFNSDTLHPTGWGHFILERFIRSKLGGSASSVKQFP